MVGAGIAGVACARELVQAGIGVRVRDRARVPGGRMATRRFDGRPVDLGAAYFTVDDPDFADVVDRWHAAGLVRRWTDTFLAYGPDGRRAVPGPLRWAAPAGLRSLVAHLARDLPVTLEEPVTSVGPGPTADGQPYAAVVLAMPDPQAARLLDPALAAATRVVGGRRWSPVLAAALHFPTRRWPDFHGAFVNEHPLLRLVCDDGDRRGDGAPVLVAHSTPEYAARHLTDPAAAGPALAQATVALLELPERPRQVYVHRWTFAAPTATRTEHHHLDDDGIGLAGDAFAGKPRVQSAWLSGRELGRALAARLRPATA